MSVEKNPLILEQYKDKSILQILFDKFNFDEDTLQFYKEGLRLANQELGLNDPREFPEGYTFGENEKLGKNNIYSITFGHKHQEGEWTEQPAIVLFVANKAPLEAVQFEYRAPEISKRFFDNRFATDVYEMKTTRKT